ncbi:MAG: FtsX-like permease family protein, partial [Acidimicrobiia bacterium]|nr:FtsX-like permease family protein [Acidimicrobiia bacterium]
QLETRTAAYSGVEIFAEKKQLLDDAERDGAEFTELFGGIGSFSVVAGILLLVNLFVMLGEERKSELGMLRAVGLKRNHLVRSFAIEGAFYAIAAAVAGTALGIGLGWVLVQLVARVFAVADQGLSLRLTVDADRLATGAAVGLGISLLTIWLTSLRIARFNIIRAIRELPEPTTHARRLRSLVVGGAGIAGGAALFFLGLDSGSAIPLMVGPALVAFAAIPIVSRFIPPKIARAALAGAALTWGVMVFPLFNDIMADSDIFTFVVQGVVMVAAAVLLVSSADRVWSWLSDRAAGSGLGIPARLGLAYPLARRFRTGLLLGMYSLVIFTMTFLAAFSAIFNAQTDSFVDEVSAGYDIIVDSSRVNPVTADTLAAQPDVASVVTLERGFAQLQPEANSELEPEWFALSGIDDAFVEFGGTTLVERSPEYATDAEAYVAVITDPSLAIVNEYLFDSAEGFGSGGLGIGDTFYVIDDDAGTEHGLTIAGISGSDIVFNGIYVTKDVADEYLSDFVTPRHYVLVTGGADAGDVAARLNGALIENGLDARTFTADVSVAIGETVSFLRLLQGFLAVGLVIGIAGLGVVLVRAVRERRRQVGMLRAMGFQSSAVRRAFLLEAAFVAVQGIVIGMALGLVTAYQVIVNSDTFGDTQLDFTMPWVGLAVVAVVPLVASLFAAVAPAARAAAVRPAVALRVAD